ncbi:mucin-5AC [Drosophila grimshawi]|uniref:mucin-5AC n=1 Tax=Drosophila grimshawi TaxID=7222 RepID=UPI000C87026E|nr:mucin-5AC [Drosophila grimshawi]
MTEKMLEVCRGLKQLLIWSQVLSLAAASAHPVWQYNDPQLATAQYAKIIARISEKNGKNTSRDQLDPVQFQYVDYQPKCKTGGEPVCATNGSHHFHFENKCKLEAANMKMLFQHGTELEQTELERCLSECENIRCNNVYAPVCATTEQTPNQGQGVSFANECEVQRRGCITKQTMRILNKGPCQQKSKSRGKARRKHTKPRRFKISSKSAPATPSNNNKQIFFMVPTEPSSTITKAIGTTTTTTTTTPFPMQFHHFRSPGNPDVSVSRAVNAYSVYNIPDVSLNYAAIIDSSLAMYLPGIGTVTDTPPSTTTTTTTTTTPRPTTAVPPTTTQENQVKFYIMSFGTTSTTTKRSIDSIDLKSAENSTRSTATKQIGTIAGTTVATTVGTTVATTVGTTLRPPQAMPNATASETDTEIKPNLKSDFLKK